MTYDEEADLHLRPCGKERVKSQTLKRGISRAKDGRRYYSSGLGRWLNRDPIGEFGGFNLYCMLGNRPPVLIDRNGLDALDEKRTRRDRLADVLGRDRSTMTEAEIEVIEKEVAALSALIEETEHWVDCVRFSFHWIKFTDLLLKTTRSIEPIDLDEPQPENHKDSGWCYSWALVAVVSAKPEDGCADVAKALASLKKNLPLTLSVTATFNGNSFTAYFSAPQAPYGGGRRSNRMQIRQAEEVIVSESVGLAATVGLKEIVLPPIEFR